jgi:tetratricopeptide (TPR) repeat protein
LHLQFTIYRGSSAPSLLRQRWRSALGPDVLLVDPECERPLPWAAVRALVGWLREAEALASALERRRETLALVLRKLGPASEIRALAPGYLSHNSALKWPLREAWLDVLGPLLVGRVLVIPDARGLDHESALLLLGLCSRNIAFQCEVGLDPDALPDTPLARRGVLNTHAALQRLVAFGSAKIEEVTGHLEPTERVPAPMHPLDDGVELRAFELLDTTLDHQDALASVLGGIEAAFMCFGFDCCLELGLRLLATRADLSASERRRVHLLVALSAYNRQVTSRSERPADDEALARLLDHHFTASLDGETDLRVRAHGNYRLAINKGRRQGEIAAALALADEAVALAREANAIFDLAWARNGRAYLHGRNRRLDLAIADCKASFDLLSRDGEADPLDIERPMTRVVLAENLAGLSTWAGEHDAAVHWAAKADELATGLTVSVPPSVRRIDALRSNFELTAALSLARRGLEISERMLDPLGADLFAADIGDLCYRRGQAAEALHAFHQALARARHDADPQRERATVIACVMAAMRADRLDEADARLAELRHTSDPQHPSELIELQAAAGVIAARRGDVPASEAAINQAIAAAVELGERDVLLRVACAAGDACLRLGRVDDAAAAFTQALQLAELDEPPSASDVLAACVGALMAGSQERHLVERSLAILEPALVDAEAWWLLEPLADACARLCPNGDRSLLDRVLREREIIRHGPDPSS